MKIVLLGSGNVATHLGTALKAAGHDIAQVYSKTEANARMLAKQLGCVFTTELTELVTDSDLYILSVSDDSVPRIARHFIGSNQILVHTSGTIELNTPGVSGVFYPIQTFSRQKTISFAKIPIAVEATSDPLAEVLLELGNSISSQVLQLNSNQRKAIHVAAVYACNFSNHLYTIAESILRDNGLDFDLLKPLIAETAGKINTYSPRSVQTGPAVRNDQVTIAKHLQFLENEPMLRDLYERLSQSIINFNQK
jgi:predicted short-subunit dehydrogenase-like oxidoreductase (DUF2520 family)